MNRRVGIAVLMVWIPAAFIMSFALWPQTLLALDPLFGQDAPVIEGGALKATTSPLIDLVIEEEHVSGKIIATELASRVRSRYASYADMGSDEIVTRILAKYPVYWTRIANTEFIDLNQRVEEINQKEWQTFGERTAALWGVETIVAFGCMLVVWWIRRGTSAQTISGMARA